MTKETPAWPEPGWDSFQNENVRKAQEQFLKEVLPAKAVEKKLAKALPKTLLEQSSLFSMLPVNPKTGQRNPQALSLDGLWFLHCVLDAVLKDPANDIAAALKDGKAVTLDPVSFEISTAENRKRLGRRWTNVAQRQGFAEFRRQEITEHWAWSPSEGEKRRGWVCVERTRGSSVLMEWEEETWQRAGRPDKSGERVNIRFKGTFTPLAGFLLRYHTALKRFYQVPALAYRMSRGAQLLFNQGLPFVGSGTGWWLTFVVACRALGYDENDSKHWAQSRQQIETYLIEIQKAVGWSRDTDRETFLAARGQIGPGLKAGWVMRGRLCLSRRRPARTAGRVTHCMRRLLPAERQKLGEDN